MVHHRYKEDHGPVITIQEEAKMTQSTTDFKKLFITMIIYLMYVFQYLEFRYPVRSHFVHPKNRRYCTPTNYGSITNSLAENMGTQTT